MTQEELDALMAEELNDDATQEEKDDSIAETLEIDDAIGDDDVTQKTQEAPLKEMHEYRTSADMSWPPPPPTDDHKMVYQLDDVTKDSELKAGQVFDKLESVNSFMMDAETNANEVIALIDGNIELFNSLCEKFPKIEQFAQALSDNKNMKAKVEDLIVNAQSAEDEIMMTMDIMQYQDIHRQKIERVINVMRALSKYMSNLFEGKVDDERRVGSAVHIYGDESTEDVVSNDDIEALIATLGKK
ncbi:MAG: chemotaxis protein [Sulfurospirillum sp.]|nr:chemotaxis protein [Sulfurospirillum sp.]